jgi:hypothetical protein
LVASTASTSSGLLVSLRHINFLRLEVVRIGNVSDELEFVVFCLGGSMSELPGDQDRYKTRCDKEYGYGHAVHQEHTAAASAQPVTRDGTCHISAWILAKLVAGFDQYTEQPPEYKRLRKESVRE